jgi:hypothetical protein
MINFFKKILLYLRIIQIVSNEKRRKQGLEKLGQGYFEAYRLNPYNPLSYIGLMFLIPFLLFLYGIIGVFSNWKNPFKWD